MEQQTFSVQNPEAHSASPMHGWGCSPQRPFWQGWAGAQSLRIVQLVLHLVPVGSQANGAHEMAVSAWQVPAPSQVRGASRKPLVHSPAAQTVPARYGRQKPFPSHEPSSPQVDGSVVAQRP